MPDPTPTDEGPGLSADELEQAGRLLMPHFVQAVDLNLSRLRADIREMFGEHEQNDVDRFQALDKRVKSLEVVKARAIAAWGVIVGFATIVYHVAKDYVLTRWAGQR